MAGFYNDDLFVDIDNDTGPAGHDPDLFQEMTAEQKIDRTCPIW